MTQTHTKGPWSINSGRIYGTSTEYPIAEIFDIYIEGEEAKANGHLISAAPELLARLEALEVWMVNYADSVLCAGHEAELAATRAAIAKARGL